MNVFEFNNKNENLWNDNYFNFESDEWLNIDSIKCVSSSQKLIEYYIFDKLKREECCDEEQKLMSNEIIKSNLKKQSEFFINRNDFIKKLKITDSNNEEQKTRLESEIKRELNININNNSKPKYPEKFKKLKIDISRDNPNIKPLVRKLPNNPYIIGTGKVQTRSVKQNNKFQKWKKKNYERIDDWCDKNKNRIKSRLKWRKILAQQGKLDGQIFTFCSKSKYDII